MWETGAAKIMRNVSPARLPADRRERWTLPTSGWEEMTLDARQRWREWFEWSVAPGGEFWDESRGGPVLIGAALDGVDLSRLCLAKALLERATLRGANLTQADLRGCDLRSAQLNNAVLNRTVAQEADFSNARLAGAVLTGADLSGATIHHTDLTELDFKDARLFATRITDPTWWVELPRATRDGQTVFQKGIPEHPIQDVLGLPPLLRRQLADVQFLRDMHRKCGRFGRAVMWAWGVTCGYGQSMGRWTAFSALVGLVFTVLFMFAPLQMTVRAGDGIATVVGTPGFGRALYMSVSTLMTLGVDDAKPLTGFGRLVTGMEAAVGFVMLGGLLSILANKMARLA